MSEEQNQSNYDYKNTPQGKETARLYADIIHLSRPVSRRPKMDLVQRAKIFSPYDALRGFDEAIDAANEKGREVPREELSEEQKEALSDKLLHLRKGMRIRVCFFVADHSGADPVQDRNTPADRDIRDTTKDTVLIGMEDMKDSNMRSIKNKNVKKTGDSIGRYVTIEGIVLRINPEEQTLEIKESPKGAGRTLSSSGKDGGKIEKDLPTVIHFADLSGSGGLEILADP